MLINKEYDWQNKCILIAEDEEINYMFIEKILEGTGATLLRATNGRQAVDIVNGDRKVDLVLMDIRMPEMDGIEAAKLIKTSKPNLPIIAQTCHESELDQTQIAGTHFDGFISKPININKLIEMVDRKL